MNKRKLYIVKIIGALMIITGSYPLFAQTWCPPVRVSWYAADYYVVLGQGLTADNFGTPWCGWCAETTNPHAFNIYVSHYFDTTWSDPDTIYPFFAFWNCDLAVDANGNVWVVAEDNGISACFYNGSSWSDLMAVPSVSCCHYPVATGDSLGNLWICWASGGPGDGHHIWGNAYIQGQWGPPVLISYPGSHEEFTYSMTTDKQGNVWVGWYWSSGFDAWICASFNNGSGWSDTMLIAEYSNTTRGPALTVDTSGKVWAGWLNRGVNEWNVYASYYDGSVWSEPILVSSELSTSWPGDWPVAITSDDKGMVWLTWMNPDTNIYYSYWNGSEWSNPAPVDIHPTKDYHPAMTFDGERIWLTWIKQVDFLDTLSVYASYTYGMGIEEEQTTNPLPSGSELRQSYPNPFSSNTTISYQLPSDCYVSLKIYNIAGELVQTLGSKNQKPGHYTVCWDGKDEAGRQVPSGVYFVRLETPNKSITKKIIKSK